MEFHCHNSRENQRLREHGVHTQEATADLFNIVNECIHTANNVFVSCPSASVLHFNIRHGLVTIVLALGIVCSHEIGIRLLLQDFSHE